MGRSRTGVLSKSVALETYFARLATMIYRWARDKANGGTLYRHLRQGHKRYRKGKNSKRSHFRYRLMNALR